MPLVTRDWLACVPSPNKSPNVQRTHPRKHTWRTVEVRQAPASEDSTSLTHVLHQLFTALFTT
ncbi:hypothetical protein BD309DRAFT_991331 [Dichomitus squalens]|uniref:Uncharacterized protein n=2 Tax=Dichomitus squalens TaxID=114155 RepID=A0A4Q9NPB3_9APHY|nr:uncharacterized protein DICSQDRAFT_157248 [Dichomitus squalens LYAD-421 SS1]EJF57650.1 hypothetical protein DICSQDRAFT_157248 [Dichomitus squalens LYAD-421 SS1]TBU42928.1 hypothetical protein BD309DRAFT_991331 [Dichomitus squalens]TBU64338.1 hypothetical protein BD310DRAFT_806370 [Dichomitus squalens]